MINKTLEARLRLISATNIKPNISEICEYFNLKRLIQSLHLKT